MEPHMEPHMDPHMDPQQSMIECEIWIDVECETKGGATRSGLHSLRASFVSHSPPHGRTALLPSCKGIEHSFNVAMSWGLCRQATLRSKCMRYPTTAVRSSRTKRSEPHYAAHQSLCRRSTARSRLWPTSAQSTGSKLIRMGQTGCTRTRVRPSPSIERASQGLRPRAASLAKP
jgi:hypothetical protein